MMLIETDRFPIEFLSQLAERESWRKEVNRPIYHVHKWWAKRLGSVFRGIILAAALPTSANLRTAFYSQVDLSGKVVFDPFLGSGTTVGEAYKLGCTSLGRDINPIACESARIGLSKLNPADLHQALALLDKSIGKKIRSLYEFTLPDGSKAQVLYWFWVKHVNCPECSQAVDLFSSYIFSRNAYPGKKPEARIICPKCNQVFQGTFNQATAHCPHCRCNFTAHLGNVTGANVKCDSCKSSFNILAQVRRSTQPPTHRIYAKLVLHSDGRKEYMAADDQDRRAYMKASKLLRSEINNGSIRIPTLKLEQGYNTKQAINYNYRYWSQFFNDRQLLALSWLFKGVMSLPDVRSRDALFVLCSGILEFNNMYASFKGEGTGAVRHMFSHHILKPERTPLEANIWGTEKSSGSLLNLYRSRLLRAARYQQNPFEISLEGNGKIYGVSRPLTGSVSEFPSKPLFNRDSVYLSCGSSEATGLPSRSVDMVVTDPPFFDNVHYSELADFFQAWGGLYAHGFLKEGTTRDTAEVQDIDVVSFERKLKAVFLECRRVLKNDGLLIFTYHHSRPEGWECVASAVVDAGFTFVNAHPVKSELANATPKTATREPILCDVIFVCKKRQDSPVPVRKVNPEIRKAIMKAQKKIERLRKIGMKLSVSDIRNILFSQWIVALSSVGSSSDIRARFQESANRLELVAKEMANQGTKG